jgi:predicted GIY-YIG superfamily endonuclease
MSSPWHCYLLVSDDGKRTYIGATVDPNRRLQQHNGEKAGGAKATHGRHWWRHTLVSGFPDSTAALQFEWAWKYRSRKHGHGLPARLRGLKDLLAAERSTSKAVPFAEWSAPPTVVTEAPPTASTETLLHPDTPPPAEQSPRVSPSPHIQT